MKLSKSSWATGRTEPVNQLVMCDEKCFASHVFQTTACKMLDCIIIEATIAPLSDSGNNGLIECETLPIIVLQLHMLLLIDLAIFCCHCHILDV